METIVLYCKSYINDLERAYKLATSIEYFNIDNIPFYISVPKSDLSQFQARMPKFVNLIEDESYYQSTKAGWKQQQIVKSNFWLTGICKNYVSIDSDSQFIRPFYRKDFMFDNETPYTVIHEQKELFSWTAMRESELGFDPKQGFEEDRLRIMNLFNRTGKLYDFGPSPNIWACKVWESLQDNYTSANNLTFENLIEYSPSEFTWYGEALLAFKAISIYPAEPLFKVFHYPLQYIEYKTQGITQSMIAKNYMGIVLQSNFNAPLTY